MKPGNTPWRPMQSASLAWDEDGSPRSTRFDDVYYAREDGLQESRYVFLEGNNLAQRWSSYDGACFTIAETGFGTGLNFLATWQAWRQLSEPRPRLHFLSIEKFPLEPQQLTRATGLWPELQALARQLAGQYPGLLPGQHRLLFENGAVILDLWWADIRDALEDLASRGEPFVDAWYLDGFAPARNEAMWDERALQGIGRLSRPGATFSTFTAAGQVRRGLVEAGFRVDKVAGFGRKRDSLRGERRQQASNCTRPDITPWDLPREKSPATRTALVIGGGLAGCTTAHALASRGIRVTLLECGELACGGSGNLQGILYTRLSRKHSPLTDFALQSFNFASKFYRDLFLRSALREGVDGALCGSFHQQDDDDELADMKQLLSAVPELAQAIDSETASSLLGVPLTSAGYWFPGSGWMNPGAVCHALVRHPGIELRENCGALGLTHRNDAWHALHDESVLASADCAIIATGTGSTAFRGLEWLPLQRIRGQTTQLPATSELYRLRGALCHDGYIAPARLGEHCIGATFDLKNDSDALSLEDCEQNLGRLADAVPAWADLLAAVDPGKLSGRVGFRCASPDYLPLVGAVPDRDAFLHDYGELRKNARRILETRGRYMPGLFVNTGHGSRGLTSTPLAAQLLASTIAGEALPMDRTLCRALSPARFLVRDLVRGRI
jgi:tRNA 5-methylaminomethyl-2-thiouridine biosynthesis bifunctional protein